MDFLPPYEAGGLNLGSCKANTLAMKLCLLLRDSLSYCGIKFSSLSFDKHDFIFLLPMLCL